MLWQSNSQVRRCGDESTHLASELQVIAPVSVLTFFTGDTSRVRRADTLPRFWVTCILSVSAVTGYSKDRQWCYIRTPGAAEGVRADATSYFPFINNLSHSSSS